MSRAAPAAHSRSVRTGTVVVGLVALLAQISFSPVLPVQRASAAPPAADVQAWLNEVHESGVPAIAAVVTRGDRMQVAVGAGEIGGRAVDEHTPFRIESLSKSFTATAVLQLVEEKQVDLDAPVLRYLPGLQVDDERAESITVRQLLNQSSGITDAALGFDQYAAGPRSSRDVGELLSRSRLDFDPGADWAYSNPNYWICAWLVEEVSGIEFNAYLQQKILDPLGMSETTSASTSDRVQGAPGHAQVYGMPVRVSGPDAWVAGAGGVTSTAHDLGIWLRFQHGTLPDGEDVLSTAMRDEMHRRQAPEGGLYALGWYSGPPAGGGVERVSHSGVGAGTGAYQGLFPDETGVAVLQASSGPDPYEVAAALYEESSTGELGAAPSAPGPSRDLLITVAAFAFLAMCVRGISRSRRWARRVGKVRAALALGCSAVAVTALFTIPVWGSMILGRAATWSVLFAGAPLPVIAVLVVAVAVGLLTVARLTRLMRIAAERSRP